jgi:hypothetical protein
MIIFYLMVVILALCALCAYLVSEMRAMRVEIGQERAAYVESLARRSGEALVMPTRKKTEVIPALPGWFAGKTRININAG